MSLQLTAVPPPPCDPHLGAYPELDPALALLPVDLLVLQVGVLPLAVVLVGEGHNIGLVALLAWIQRQAPNGVVVC